MRVRAEWTGSSHPINLAAAVEIFAEALGRRLPEPDLSEWWHIICTGPETLVHFMDLERPVAVNSSKIELS